MELFLVIGLFSGAFFLLSIGVILGKKQLHAGSCGSNIKIEGEALSCGACPSKEAELCASGDKDGLATLSQLGNPTRKNRFKKLPFSEN
jgi:hypothetical protein